MYKVPLMMFTILQEEATPDFAKEYGPYLIILIIFGALVFIVLMTILGLWMKKKMQ